MVRRFSDPWTEGENMNLKSVKLLTLALLVAAGCLFAAGQRTATPVQYSFNVLVERSSGRGGTEPVTQRVRIQVRGDDGSLLFSGWTRDNGTLNVTFGTVSKAQQIEATLPDVHLPDHEPRFNGAIVGMEQGIKKYCIILPPGCLF